MEKQEWVFLELMGHRMLAGRLSEVERAGTKLFRIEVPLGPPPADGTPERFFVQDYSSGALYAVTPVTEQAAREKATFTRPSNVVALLGAGASTPNPSREEMELDRAALEEEDLEDLPAGASPGPAQPQEEMSEEEAEAEREEFVRLHSEEVTNATSAPSVPAPTTPEIAEQAPVPPVTDDIPF